MYSQAQKLRHGVVGRTTLTYIQYKFNMAMTGINSNAMYRLLKCSQHMECVEAAL